ncbi:AraC family transcriptional regulator [Marivivens donghaensis]|uniref:AraC family transcriptional regulator n=2 Tax=Marivivens donghaensis TaxID=1699413 RepID=A0ABX0VT99_9RHOB|nr:AraC family transcriptional regulator [Marivivens donghaensis]
MKLSRATLFGGFDVLESRVHRFEYTPHRHAEVVIAAYEGGFKRACCDRHTFEVQCGDLLVIGPETLHSGSTVDGPGWRYLSIYLSIDQIAEATGLEAAEIERCLAGHRVHRRPSSVSDLPIAIGDPLALGEFLANLCAHQTHDETRQEREPSPAIGRVRERLNDDPTMPVTLVDLARLADISPEHLSRRFRAETGLSPFQYLTSLRVRAARERIAGGSGLAEAALAAGFADQSHMTRWFKRSYGITPGMFAASRSERDQTRSRRR